MFFLAALPHPHVCFLCCSQSWFYYRLVVFPLVIITKVFTRFKMFVKPLEQVGRGLFGLMLLTLFVLHIYWFSSFPKYVIGALKQGKLETDSVNADVLSKDEKASAKAKRKAAKGKSD